MAHEESLDSRDSETWIDRGTKINDANAFPLIEIEGRSVRLLGGTMLGNIHGTTSDVMHGVDEADGQILQLSPSLTRVLFDAEEQILA